MNDSCLPEFDEEVIRAMARWPDVPQCFGWLSLDRRGRWRIQNEPIGHRRAVEFLSRHYRADESGRWYVQNGPQKVFVALDYTPWIIRFDIHQGFTTHTGIVVNDISAAYSDDEGNLLIECGVGIGLLDDRDLAAVAGLIDDSDPGHHRLTWRGHNYSIATLRRAQVETQFGFQAQPTESQ